MSNYNGRRAPNVSQYIANLNTIPSAADLATQQDFSNFDDDLAMFTNTQFFDFDMNENVPDLPTFSNDHGQPDQVKNMSFANPPSGFQFSNFSGFPGMSNHASPHTMSISPPNGIPGAFAAHQSQPTIPDASAFAQLGQTGEKRKAESMSVESIGDLEESSRYAAEEDKRRRNTAASARFRVKKKQREQALEKSAKDMSDKVAVLEARVGQLEMENKWLKGLITEKSNSIKRGLALPAAAAETSAVGVKAETVKEAVAVVTASAEAQTTEEYERSPDTRKKGVGTEGEVVEV